MQLQNLKKEYKERTKKGLVAVENVALIQVKDKRVKNLALDTKLDQLFAI